jgi:hypothetical protein
MTELKVRFSLADDIDTRDLWGDARRRAAAPEAPPRAVDWPPALGRRVAAAAVALAVFATAGVFAWDLSHPDVVPPPPPPATDTPVDLAAELPEGWSELPAPPEVRSGAATAWSGSQLFVWGGFVFGGSGDKPSSDDGFVFDAVSREWLALPPSPLGARSLAASAWTGRELLVWGGTDLDAWPYEGYEDGAAFDPSTQRWRSLPPAPIEGRAPMSVWTGEELIVWGTAVRVTPRPTDGAAFDPDTDTWRRIADAPIELTDATAVWTGEEMIVFGAALRGGNFPETETAIGAAYDPDTDSWRELPPSELSPQASTAAWTGRELVAWDYLNGTAAYDPISDRWRELPRVPIDDYECTPQSVSIPGHVVFGNYCGITPVFPVAKDRWRDISRRDLSGWVLEPVAAGSAVLIMAHGLELSEVPDQAFDSRMLAYVPPGEAETGAVRAPAPFVPATATTGDTTRMPLVFPDGTKATLVYPKELRLAEMGVQPDVSYVWKEYPPPRFPIVFLHDRDASIASFVEGTKPVGHVNSYVSIEIWAARGNNTERRFWLRFSLPSWTVLVSVRDASSSPDEVAASLEMRESASGFPVVEASGPISLAEGFGEAEGPQLGIGDGAADPSRTSLDPLILLSPDGCGLGDDKISPSAGYASLCLGGGAVFASVYGDPSFIRRAFDTLAVEPAFRT